MKTYHLFLSFFKSYCFCLYRILDKITLNSQNALSAFLQLKLKSMEEKKGRLYMTSRSSMKVLSKT